MLSILLRSSVAKIRPSTINSLALNCKIGNGSNIFRDKATKPDFRIKIVPVSPESTKTYMDKNKQLKRPQSPHLTIYKPQLTSLTSISLRASGLYLSCVAWGLGLLILCTDKNMDYFIDKCKELDFPDWFWCMSRFTIAFPFSFHLCNGIRHLIFMTATFLEIKPIYMTAYMMMILSVLLAGSLVYIKDLEKLYDEMKKESEKKK